MHCFGSEGPGAQATFQRMLEGSLNDIRISINPSANLWRKWRPESGQKYGKAPKQSRVKVHESSGKGQSKGDVPY